MIRNLQNTPQTETEFAIPCFSAAPDDKVFQSFEVAIFGADKFRQTSRWQFTTLSGFGLVQGEPTIITYSFAPDGTDIGSGVGEPLADSNLFTVFNTLHGSPAVWQEYFHQVFDRWSELCGITYQFEPNDDGAALFSNTGVSGVRGDVRIGGKFIDGQSGSNVLAYNYTPNNGDMVLDTANTSFYGNTNNGALGLRNVISHEHGHGIGMLHVCPTNETKLMEPFISTSFNGPQHDDILNAQRHYGDPLEDNDAAGEATPLGALPDGLTTINTVSLDDDSDVDFYSFTVTPGTTLSTTASPAGSTYFEGAQNPDGSCTAGTNFNSLTLNDILLSVVDTNGSSVLASANNGAAGTAESISGIVLQTAGPYYIRVSAGSANTVQLYSLGITLTSPGGSPPTATRTATSSPSPTRTATALATATTTRTFTSVPPSSTPTASRTNTQVPTPTRTSTPVPPTPTETETVPKVSTPTATLTPTSTPTNTLSPTSTVTDTSTPTVTATATSTSTKVPTETRTSTATETAPPTPTQTATQTDTRTSTETPTETLEPTSTATATPTETTTDTVTETPTDTVTETPSETSTLEPTVTPTETGTEAEAETPTPTASETTEPSATETQGPTPTETPTSDQPPTPTETDETPLAGYDVAPIKGDGDVDIRDLLIWVDRIDSSSEEARMLFGFSLYWSVNEPTP